MTIHQALAVLNAWDDLVSAIRAYDPGPAFDMTGNPPMYICAAGRAREDAWQRRS